MEDQVTLFTASDFGRSMLTNGSGSDHGWGSHHFVVGGAVQGGRLYGQFPAFGRDVGHDVNGRLVPRYSVEQYAAAPGPLVRALGQQPASGSAQPEQLRCARADLHEGLSGEVPGLTIRMAGPMSRTQRPALPSAGFAFPSGIGKMWS